MTKVTFRFPMAVDTGGAVATDATVVSQLHLLASVSQWQWIGKPEFGFPAYDWEQGPLSGDVRRSLVLVCVKRAIAQYVPGCVVVSMELRKTSEDKRLLLDIGYLDRASFMRPQRAIVGIYTGEETDRNALV